MVGYSLWTNWTTQYLVDEHRLSLSESAWYAWIPPVFALAGGNVAYCWGDDLEGQLGNGTTNLSASPVKVIYQP